MTEKLAYKELEKKTLELKKSKEKFKTLFNLTFEGILTHDKGVAIDVNTALIKMIGYTREELIGKNIIQLCALQEYHNIIQQNIVKQSAKPYEIMLKKKNGTIFPAEIEGRDIKDENKQFRVAAIRDITERKQVEETLKQNEQELKSIFRAAPTGIGVVCDRVIHKVNIRFCEMTGYSQNELIGQHARILYPSDEEFEYVGIEKYRQISETGTGTVETKFQCKDGKIIDVLMSSTPIDLNDLLKGVTFTALDITYLKKKEVELSESEKKYRSMMEAMDEPAYICSSEYIIEYMNPAMVKKRGKDGTGGFCHQVIHGLDKKCPWCVFEKVIKDEPIHHEIVSPKDNRTYHISNAPIFHMDGTVSKLTIFRDITDFKTLETRLQQAQKMESIGTLAGGIAHDFNNILFPILGHAEMLMEDVPEDSPFKNGLNQIHKGAMRASELVKQILTFSRQHSNELKLMKIQYILKEALKLIRSTIPTTISIKQNIDSKCGVIKADPTQIHQIVMNLATNAFHAMEETGGELNVTLKEIELGEFDRINPDMKTGVYACLTIADTGMGMNKNLIKKIFDPYFTTKKIGKGTGMGLSVVHGIVKSMEGAIHVYSEPDKGTEFHVYLPLVKNFSQKNETHQTIKPLQGGMERILLVDDEEAIITMEKLMLERLGYQVTSYTSSIDALEVFRADPDKFDVVITDLQMPNMSGKKLSAEFTKIRSDIPVLLCTGFSDTMSEEKASSIGIKGVLLKPIVMKDLAYTIRKTLDANGQ